MKNQMMGALLIAVFLLPHHTAIWMLRDAAIDHDMATMRKTFQELAQPAASVDRKTAATAARAVDAFPLTR